jgi:hypothetical protein
MTQTVFKIFLKIHIIRTVNSLVKNFEIDFIPFSERKGYSVENTGNYNQSAFSFVRFGFRSEFRPIIITRRKSERKESSLVKIVESNRSKSSVSF